MNEFTILPFLGFFLLGKPFSQIKEENLKEAGY